MRDERFSNTNEIKRTLTFAPKGGNVAGPFLYHDGDNAYAHTKEGHMMILGVSGCGKSRRLMMPSIRSFIDAKESFLVVDPKGELYRETAGALGEGYNTKVINFRDVYASTAWNPLAYALSLYRSGDDHKRQEAASLIDELATGFYAVHPEADPYWAESARSTFIGLTLGLFECADENEVNIASIHHALTAAEEDIDSFARNLQHKSTAAMLGVYTSAADKTRASICTSALEGISMFARSEALRNLTAHDELKIQELDGETPTAIYVIIPDETPIFDRLAGVLCSQILSHYMRIAYEKYNGTLPIRLNVCLEELGNIGNAITTLPHLMSAGRSRNIRLQLVLQSLSQLDDIYGASKACTIQDNADVTIAFRVNHWNTLKELSQKCGERTVHYGNRTSNEPLITPTQLGAMTLGQALILVSGRTRFVTWLPDYSTLYAQCPPPKPDICKGYAAKAAKVFDMSTYAKRAEILAKTARRSKF